MGSQTNDGGTKAGAPELLGIRILGGRTLFRPVMDLARQLSCPHTNHNGTKAGAPELLGVRILGGRTLFCPVMDLARQRHINCQTGAASDLLGVHTFNVFGPVPVLRSRAHDPTLQ